MCVVDVERHVDGVIHIEYVGCAKVCGREMGWEKMALLNLLMFAVRFVRYVRDSLVSRV